LFDDLQGLPRNSTVRKMNDLIKRARTARVHAVLVSYLKKQMPTFGKDGINIKSCFCLLFFTGKKKELLRALDKVFEHLSIEYKIPISDFPPIDETRKKLAG